MAGYYNKDPNFDYSKELMRTDLSTAERERLTQERQNKIEDKYGKEEPKLWGSDKTYTQVYGGGDSGASSSSEPVKGPGYVTGGYTPGAVYGTPMLEQNPYWKDTIGSGADMSRRPDLAGSYAVSNGYTVFYDEDGYATRARKGVVDYTPHQDLGVGANGSYGASGAWTDNEILTAADRQRIQDIRARMQAGQITGDQANQLANQIRSGYGYTIDKAGNVTDLGALSSVDARRRAWGLPANPVSAEQQNFLQLMFPEQGTGSGEDLLGSLYALHQGTYNPQIPYTAPQAGATGSLGGGMTGSLGGGGSDLTQYLRDVYQQNIAAQQAALTAAYDQNVADYRAQDDLIADVHNQQRNQLAAQNDLERMRMAEFGIAQGLNTGATGQLALAQSAAMQGGLAELGAQEARSLAENALNLRKLGAQYQAAMNQAAAEGNAQLAAALYDEYVRQENLAWQRYQYLQDQQRYAQQTARTEAMDRAELLAGFGDFSGYRALGYSDGDIAAMQRAYDAQFGTNFEQGSTGRASAGAGGGTISVRSSGGYNNGGLTAAQVQELQRYYGVTADGLWGGNSKKAAGGLTADQAWTALQGLRQNIGMNRTEEGRVNAIQSAGSLTEAQANYLLQQFGLI